MEYSCVSVLCCFGVGQSRLTLCDPMKCSTPGFSVLHHHPGFLKLMSIELVMPSTHRVLCPPLLLLPSIFPSIRGFSNEVAIRIRWPKYWSFNFSLSNEYSGLIRIYWFNFLAVQGTLKRVFFKPQVESINSSVLILYGPTLTSVHDYWKNHCFDYTDLCQNDV